jgi:hypothetical protein
MGYSYKDNAACSKTVLILSSTKRSPAERIFHFNAGCLGVHWNYPDRVWLPQRLGVLGIPGVLRGVRLSLVCDIRT